MYKSKNHLTWRIELPVTIVFFNLFVSVNDIRQQNHTCETLSVSRDIGVFQGHAYHHLWYLTKCTGP